jgi:hypothetical protein
MSTEPCTPKRVVVNTPGTTRSRSSTALSPKSSIASALTLVTDRGVAPSGRANPSASLPA